MLANCLKLTKKNKTSITIVVVATFPDEKQYIYLRLHFDVVSVSDDVSYNYGDQMKMRINEYAILQIY